ncbi:hypothetical protein B9N43_13725 [Denitratisoma sp. DHT3]|uniref:c-type cytochrome n=1 Tax=Denitratisoma sp. DHT3 TaxID=1981880 RepID=UPI0011989735|nr:c-type cytochrome [Denitratisoma sp. DHT3]QDX82211.1 hypothetical protein B9N43_13725 [Denitratisoma sp. DHT3]
MRKISIVTAIACLPFLPLTSQAQNADAAKALLKKNDCFKCHALDKKKDGPSYKEVASKRKGDPDAMEKLTKHMTTAPKVKIDGKEEEHKQIKATSEEIKNLINWILSL